MLNCFFEGRLEGRITLDRAESHHLVSVRRARTDADVRLLDGRGRIASAVLVTADAKAAVVDISSVSEQQRDTPPLTLLQALPVGKTMDLIVQKATELGAARIVPIYTRFSEVRLPSDRASRKADKWRQVAVEAIKQCGNPFLPQIEEPTDFASAMDSLPAGAGLVCSLEEGTQSIPRTISEAAVGQGVTFAVGPEGDFAPEEYARMSELGFRPVTLGPLVLRAETAAIAALSIIGASLRERV